MSQFDLAEFENRVQTLLAAHRQLQADYQDLARTLEAERQRNQQARQRLSALLEQIRALEAEHDNP